MTKRVFSILTILSLVICLLSSCTDATIVPSTGITITDSVGRTVTAPKDARSICTLCPFSGQMAILLGAGERITSTVNNVSRSELLREICPSIRNSSVVKNSGSVNAEEILRLQTDLIIVNESTYINADEKTKLDAIGVPYVVIGFETIAEQLAAVEILGQTLEKESEAGEYIEYFQNIMEMLSASNKAKPPRLYHAVNEAVRTDTAGSYCAEWISYTGAINVSTEGDPLRIDGNKAYTTLEQIYAWDPDLIICNEAKVDDYILTDSKWQGLRAVNEARVYQIPIGVTRWGHPNSVETPLAMLWLAKLLYPESFNDLDLEQETRRFYEKFYNYSINDAWLTAIMEADEMRTPKTEKGGDAA